MKKLRLNPEALLVERFETVGEETEAGTVLGQELLLSNRTACGTCYETCATGGVRPCPYCP
jgi:hypothetical protein